MPTVAFAPTVTDIVEEPEPGAGIVLGEKVNVCALPSPTAVKAIAALNPFETVVVIVALPVAPLETVIDVGDALMAKLGTALVTFSVTVVVSVVPPELPVTVIL